MKKLLIGLIVLVALLSVPMAAMAATTDETIVSATIEAYIEVTTTAELSAWELSYTSTDNNTKTDDSVVDINSNFNFTISANATDSGYLNGTPGDVLMVNPVALRVEEDGDFTSCPTAIDDATDLLDAMQVYYTEDELLDDADNAFSYDTCLYQIVDITDDADLAYSITINWEVQTLP